MERIKKFNITEDEELINEWVDENNAQLLKITDNYIIYKYDNEINFDYLYLFNAPHGCTFYIDIKNEKDCDYIHNISKIFIMNNGIILYDGCTFYRFISDNTNKQVVNQEGDIIESIKVESSVVGFHKSLSFNTYQDCDADESNRFIIYDKNGVVPFKSYVMEWVATDPFIVSNDKTIRDLKVNRLIDFILHGGKETLNNVYYLLTETLENM